LSKVNFKAILYPLLVSAPLIFGAFTSIVPTPLVEYVASYTSVKYKKEINSLLFVGANRQKMYLIKNNELVRTYDISTSKFGCGQEYASKKTPLGLHKISSKLGKNCPVGGIIVGSNYTGKIAPIETNPVSTGVDELTTRALKLEGAESGLNKGGKNDSHRREIYIHGTPEEGLIGTPASHGCIRMRNKDIVELFDMVKENFYVLILEN
jgi:lipoprotein-anchoring transpeptidase ErfK/SrfK